MLIDEKINELQNLTKRKITNIEIAKILGLGSSQAVINRVNRKQQLKEYEILKLNDAFKNEINKTNHIETEIVLENNDSVTLDYYPDVFGSCGNGVFELSQEKDQIIVPKKAFFEKFSPVKQYSVINAKGNSMMPLFYDNDKLIVEHWNGEQIIDNKPYIFCYKDEIFIKRLAKNVDQLMIISENKDYDIRKLTGELERCKAIKNGIIEQVDPEYFANIRKSLMSP